jgi:hypothetical protein
LRLLTLLSPKWAFYNSSRGSCGGRWSAGVRLGWESGFNSGRTPDYVRNRPDGFTPLGG